MKALILSAGYGTRLRPHTDILPKPLFPIGGRPVVDLIIQGLVNSGCTGIILNTHHLHRQIADYISGRSYPIPVQTAYEPEILGTGGAIRNVSAFLGKAPFMVINSDIITDVDFSAVYRFHLGHSHPATLVMHDYEQFNNVWVDKSGRIVRFHGDPPPGDVLKLAFTGIQVLDPQVIKWIPENRPVSSIDIFQHMIDSNCTLAAYVAKHHYWRDIGTPQSCFEAAYEYTLAAAFEQAFGNPPDAPAKRRLLAGDGSDRRWYRISWADQSLILADHGITATPRVSEIDSFLNIGNHLRKAGVPVPEIYFSDRFSGIVYMEDFGDIHLQTAVTGTDRVEEIIGLYKQVIDAWAHMAVSGAAEFDPAWTCQTPRYDRDLILERECRYFVEALLSGYLDFDTAFEELRAEFEWIADRLLHYELTGFMHRDFQSRNIMVMKDRIGFIDFQGGRLGPVQYDLAALLCDPYFNLPGPVRERLLRYALEQVKKRTDLDPKKFIMGFQYCAVTRLLQALGAFGFLAGQKNKPFFAPYIPAALDILSARLRQLDPHRVKKLRQTVRQACEIIKAEGLKTEG